MNRKLLLAMASVTLLQCCADCRVITAAEIHISPGGNDDNPGTRAKPYASLHRAQLEARQRAGHETVTVWLHAGVYYLATPLQITAKDSGSPQMPVSYRAAEDDVIVSGGKLLKLDWTPLERGLYQADTPPGMAFDQLFVDGQRQHLARYPNYDPDVRHFSGFAANAFSKQRAAGWKDPRGGFMHAMHQAHWGGYHYRITGKNSEGELTYEGGWQNNRQSGMHPEHRFVENIFEELDAAGEWFHDANARKLFYKPSSAIELATARIEVVRLPHLVEFIGTEELPVRNVSLQGITFRHAARTFMKNREPLLRSDWTIYRGGAVFLTGTEQCRVLNCTFDQVGGNAIFVNNYNRNVEIVGCHIHDAGASGVCFVGHPRAVRSPLFNYSQRQSFEDIDKTPGPRSHDYPSHCLIDNCLIERTGRVEKQTAAVQISMASEVTVRHCSIYEVPRAGINISEGTFGGHLIEFCDVFDTVLETGDHGSFNSWGRDRFWGLNGTPDDQLPELAKLDMVDENIIRNSRWRCDHGWDIDLDDGSSNYRVYNNLLLSGGLKFREGFHRVAENNILAGNSFHPHVWYKNSGDVLRNNIVFTPYKPIRVPSPWGSVVDFNLLHQPGSDTPTSADVLAKQSGRDEHSVIADAMFVNPEAGDFTLKAGSPALKLGFKNFSMDQFGVQLPKLKNLARTPKIQLEGQPPHGHPNRPGTRLPIEHFWNGAAIRDLTGEEFSSFGVSKESAGVHLSNVPQDCDAADVGFAQNDLIQQVNDRPVRSVAELLSAQNDLAGQSMRVVIVRQQQPQRLDVPRYSYFTTHQSNNASFEQLSISLEEAIPLRSVVTKPNTHNQPPTTLTDEKLSADYGPVFGNGQHGGVYKVSLGESQSIQSIATVTFNQNNRRGPQRFAVFGSNAETDPGWDSRDRSVFVPIGEVDTTDQTAQQFQATELRSSSESLGQFRWLLWVVYPVTGQAENSAFQEFVITANNR